MDTPVSAKCKICKKIVTFVVDQSAIEARAAGKTVREAFKDLPMEKILQLESGTCPECRSSNKSEQV